MSTSRRTTAARLAALAALPLLLLLGLASCSAGDESPSADQTPTSQQDLQSWQLAFAQCMRDEGIDYKDPEKDGSQSASVADESSMEASEKCSEQVGPPPVQDGDQGSKPGGPTDFFKASKCLRENGVDIEDPDENNALSIPEGVAAETMEKCGLPAGVSGSTISGVK